MRSTGIRRKVDDLGRVVIPAGIRRSLHIREGDEVEVHVDGERVVLSKPAVRCIFCGTEDEPLQTYRDRRVCRGCVASVGVLDDSLRERAREAAASPSPSGWQPPAAVVETPAPDPDEPLTEAPDITMAGRQAPHEAADGTDAARDPLPARDEPAAADAPRPEPASREPSEDEPEDEPLYDPASTTAW